MIFFDLLAGTGLDSVASRTPVTKDLVRRFVKIIGEKAICCWNNGHGNVSCCRVFRFLSTELRATRLRRLIKNASEVDFSPWL